MGPITIKPCTMKGFSQIIPMLETHGEVFDYSTKRRIMQLTNKELDINPTDPSLYLAEHEGTVVGFIGFKQDDQNPANAELFGQVIKKGFQKQGVGSKLLQQGLQKLKSLGTNQVTVSLKASAPSYVRDFYKNAGFKPMFDEEYTGASDEDNQLILIFDEPADSVPQAFYPA